MLSSRYANVEVGDILIFESRPDTDYGFAQQNMKNQWWLSCLFFSCFGTDHRKTHAAICVQKEEKEGSIKVAHLRADGFEISALDKSDPQLAARLKKSNFVIMRPNDTAFKNELCKVAALSENKEIKWDLRSYDESVTCCGTTSQTRKTKSGFSIASTCSRFIVEAINLAAINADRPLFIITKQNPSVMRLYWLLQASKQYECLAPDQKSITSEAKVDPTKEAQTPFLFDPH